MTRVLHFLFVAPIGRLPYGILYRLADALAKVLWWSGYRRDVVLANLQRAFPDQSESERVASAQQFYVHLAEVLVESLRHFHAGKDELSAHGFTMSIPKCWHPLRTSPPAC